MNGTAKGKYRVSATFSDSQVAKIDEIATRMGLSRSATLSFLANTAMESYEMFAGLPEDKMKIVVSALNGSHAV